MQNFIPAHVSLPLHWRVKACARGDTVSVLLPNTPAMLEVHHGVPMTGGVLNALNTRLDPRSIAFMLDHSEARIFIVDREFAACANAALELAAVKPLVLVYDDPEFRKPESCRGRGL